MVEHLGRKIALILVLLAGAVVSLLVAGFRLGLDLQGGTRLVYSLDIEGAVKEGIITEQEAANPRELVNQFISIIKERIDPQGVREPIVRPEGDNRIVIELPGAGTEVRKTVAAGLAEPLPADGEGAASISLSGDDEALRDFPTSGGVVQVGTEKIRYRKRIRGVLTGLERGNLQTTAAAHAVGAQVRLINSDPWQELIENVGSLSFFILAKDADFKQQTDLTTDRSKVEAWVDANPDTPISAFNRLPMEDGGPFPRLRWFPMEDDGFTPLKQRLQPLIKQENEDWNFSGDDLASVRPSQDQLGYPAVAFDMSTATRSAFSDFTGAHIEEQMAIVINDVIATFPRINSRLPGGGIIEGGAGGFTNEEVNGLVTVLRSGSLKIKPELEHRERVGATLGDDYVARGALSCVIGLVTVLLFVMFYYRRLGVFAGISLLVNLTLLMGALSFLQATLTLPGVAGIILTVGMAVDANILIYERIREEALRGRKPHQAAKDGFANAMSTIIDANLTTLITGWILYLFGTGPVRGFATTLCIGILTSVFSALVITRILVHVQLEKGIKEFSMARLISETKIGFMGKRKQAFTGSLIAIAAGLALFFSIPAKQKLGIDFLGGVTMTVRTQEPQDVQTVRDRVQAIDGLIGKSSEVKSILSSEASGGGFTQFRITSKADGNSEDSQALKDTVENEVRRALADMLEKGPYEIQVDGTAASGTLYFESERDLQGVETILASAGVSDIQLSQVTGPAAAYGFTGTVGLDKDTAVLSQLIEARFSEGLDGEEYRWASTVPEVAVVGAQVVSELRDKAIFAILLSLFAAVMYIRVRFAEYSYGWAAVTALVHDVLITLGVLAVAMKLDLIEVEINLPMIAAFLTIIGYSLNDTIVVFDRVRENMPRMKGSLSEVIDRSINQTLSRTLLTSLTTLMTVIILLAFNLGSRNVLEGFAFALSIGVIVGTYSSMFIACPALLFLESKRLAKEAADAAEEGKGPQAVQPT